MVFADYCNDRAAAPPRSMNLASKILMAPDVVTQQGLDALVSYIRSTELKDLSVFDADATNQSNAVQWVVNKKVRNTQTAPVEPFLPQLDDLLVNIIRDLINPFYGVEISGYETPQFLRYGVGGMYEPHIDGESMWMKEDGTKVWRKSVERDLSLVLYLNDDFEGGEFVFPDLGIRVTPRAGLLLCFPSSHHYRHGVMPVTKGERLAVVSWMTVKGWKTMAEEAREFEG